MSKLWIGSATGVACLHPLMGSIQNYKLLTKVFIIFNVYSLVCFTVRLETNEMIFIKRKQTNKYLRGADTGGEAGLSHLPGS